MGFQTEMGVQTTCTGICQEVMFPGVTWSESYFILLVSKHTQQKVVLSNIVYLRCFS